MSTCWVVGLNTFSAFIGLQQCWSWLIHLLCHCVQRSGTGIKLQWTQEFLWTFPAKYFFLTTKLTSLVWEFIFPSNLNIDDVNHLRNCSLIFWHFILLSWNCALMYSSDLKMTGNATNWLDLWKLKYTLIYSLNQSRRWQSLTLDSWKLFEELQQI